MCLATRDVPSNSQPASQERYFLCKVYRFTPLLFLSPLIVEIQISRARHPSRASLHAPTLPLMVYTALFKMAECKYEAFVMEMHYYSE